MPYKSQRTDSHEMFVLQMDNQLRSGCLMTYTFIERRSLVRTLLFYGPISYFSL